MSCACHLAGCTATGIRPATRPMLPSLSSPWQPPVEEPRFRGPAVAAREWQQTCFTVCEWPREPPDPVNH